MMDRVMPNNLTVRGLDGQGQAARRYPGDAKGCRVPGRFSIRASCASKWMGCEDQRLFEVQHINC